MFLFLLGKPAAGKTHIGNLLSQYRDFYFYDGDDTLTPTMRDALAEGRLFDDAMREAYLAELIPVIARLQTQHPRLVIAQGLAKNRHREMLAAHFPALSFCWIESDETTRLARLKKRNEGERLAYWQRLSKEFEAPTLPHEKIVNAGDSATILAQFKEGLLEA